MCSTVSRREVKLDTCFLRGILGYLLLLIRGIPGKINEEDIVAQPFRDFGVVCDERIPISPLLRIELFRLLVVCWDVA